MIMSIFVI